MLNRAGARAPNENGGPDHARETYDAFAAYYDEFTAHHDYDGWTRTLEGLARSYGARGRRLLDVACGTGKSFLPYLDRGYEVVACDISQAMVELAAAKAADRARLEVCDMRALPRLGEFDLVCCIDDAANYVLDYHELVSTFAGLARNLAPGGVVLFDVNSLTAYRTFFASMSVLVGEQRVLVWDGHVDEDFGEGDLALATVEALNRREDGTWWRDRILHRQRHHSRATVERALGAAGLELRAVRGMHLDGALTETFDELKNTKAVYVARAGSDKASAAARVARARSDKP
jgi:SAM-dependent methyltransferase